MAVLGQPGQPLAAEANSWSHYEVKLDLLLDKNPVLQHDARVSLRSTLLFPRCGWLHLRVSIIHQQSLSTPLRSPQRNPSRMAQGCKGKVKDISFKNMQRHCLEIKSGRLGSLLKDLSAVIAATLGILPNQSSNLRNTGSMHKTPQPLGLRSIIFQQPAIRFESGQAYDPHGFISRVQWFWLLKGNMISWQARNVDAHHYSWTSIAWCLPNGNLLNVTTCMVTASGINLRVHPQLLRYPFHWWRPPHLHHQRLACQSWVSKAIKERMYILCIYIYYIKVQKRNDQTHSPQMSSTH